MGRYLESDVALPDGALTLNSMVKLENGNLRICYYSADGGQMYADSQDAGKTWDTPVSIGNLLGDAGKNLELYAIQLSKDGGFFLPEWIRQVKVMICLRSIFILIKISM